jgi:large subunit ribosomal protein L29
MPNATELRELDDEELEGRLAEYRRELLNLRFQLATGQLDNVSRLSVVRKDVARVLTVLRDREIAAAEGRYAGPVILDRPVRRRPLDEDEIAVEEEVVPRRSRRTRARAAADTEELDSDAVVDDVDDDDVDDDDVDDDVGVGDVTDDEAEDFDDAATEIDDDDAEADEEDR